LGKLRFVVEASRTSPFHSRLARSFYDGASIRGHAEPLPPAFESAGPCRNEPCWV
jgi:hypothetical protein